MLDFSHIQATPGVDIQSFFGDSDASYTHACEVSHHPQVEPIILWCKQNLDDTWRWQIVETSGNSPGRYIFYFNIKVSKYV